MDRRLFGRPGLVLALCMACAFAGSAFLSYQRRDAMLVPDEMAYIFEAKLLNTGRLMAHPPPGIVAGKEAPPEVRFTHHLVTPRGWGAMYPPGWPLVLAIGERINAGWVVTPLLGVLLLWLTYCLGRHLFGVDAGILAALLLFPCPFFFINTSGEMAHALAACMVTAALYFVEAGISNRKPSWIGAAFLLTGLCLFARPFTALAASLGIGFVLLFRLWPDRFWFRLVPYLLGGFCLIALLFGVENKQQTGSFLTSPYAISGGERTPPEFTLDVHAILADSPRETTSSILLTVLYSTPFLFLLALYGVVQRVVSRSRAALLLSVFCASVVLYVFDVVPNVYLPGQRMYFEGLPGVAVLAAVGACVLLRRWDISKPALAAVLSSLCLVQATQYGITVWDLQKSTQASLTFHRALEGLKIRDAVVFMRADHMASDASFEPWNFNVNEADWQHAPLIYLIDPGPSRRADVARSYGRLSWVLVTYDGAREKCLIGYPHAAAGT